MTFHLSGAIAELIALTADDRRDEAVKLAKRLASEGSRERGSVRPRGTIEKTDRARVDEGLLLTLVERVPGTAPPEVLDVVGELGGSETAQALATRLSDPDSWRDQRLRDFAIAALETLGGIEATATLTKIATASDGNERSQSLDALVSLASADSIEVAHGGVMPIPRTAIDLWNSSREKLVRDPIGWAVESLDLLGETEPRASAVRDALLVAAESRFRRLSQTSPTSGDAPAYVWFKEVRSRSWLAAEALNRLKNARRRVVLNLGDPRRQREGVASVSFVDGEPAPGPVELLFGGVAIGRAVVTTGSTKLFDKPGSAKDI